ncbi:MAG: MFS transporter [Candidatus Hydrogenedentota bacterium]
MDALSDSSSRFRIAQWRILLATMFCYLFFYTGRQTFGFAIPGIQEELGISKISLGWASTALLWSYAVGQSINGNLGDKFGGRRMMSTGAVFSCGLNWCTSFGTNLMGLIIPWSVNGYAQSMGWAPGSRVISNWWGHRERGKVYGLYVFAAGMSSVLAFTTSALILEFGLGWRWIFRLPVLLLLVGGVAYYLIARDRPQNLGFPALDYDEDDPIQSGKNDSLDSGNDESEETSLQRYKLVFANRRFIFASIAIGFQSMARYGLLIWVPVYFLGEDWKNSDTKWISIALPVGMALGALMSGWLSDRLFRSNRSRVIVLFMVLAAFSSLTMYFLPRDHPAGIAILFLTGFFAYGPQSAFWALCPDMLGHQRAGTGTGIMNMFAYIFAGFGEPFIGWMIESNGNNTALVFPIVSTACIASSLVALTIRR